MNTVCVTTDITTPIVPPPPGFRQFSWPREECSVGGEPSLFDFAKGLPDDSVIANVGSSREESNTPSETVVVTQPLGDALLVETDSKALSDSPSPDVEGTFSELPLGPVADSPQGMTNRESRHSLGRVPRWRLAREGPFLAERSSSSLRSFGAFRNTAYRTSDYASPHPLSRDQAMDAAIQLHRDVCMMTTNLDALDQYALSLQGTASKMLQLGLGSSDFPSADVAALWPWGPESAELPSRWRLWVCGDPRWSQSSWLRTHGSVG